MEHSLRCLIDYEVRGLPSEVTLDQVTVQIHYSDTFLSDELSTNASA